MRKLDGRVVWKVCRRTVVFWILVEKREGKDHLEDPGVDGRIILKLIFS